jgi:uncharacterized membrane protein YhaH (DUF805 family)
MFKKNGGRTMLLQKFQTIYQRLKTDPINKSIIWLSEDISGLGFFKIFMIRSSILFLIYFITSNLVITLGVTFFLLNNLIEYRVKSFSKNAKIMSKILSSISTLYLYFSFTPSLVVSIHQHDGFLKLFYIIISLLFFATFLFLIFYKRSKGKDHLEFKGARATWAEPSCNRANYISVYIQIIKETIIFCASILILTFLVAYFGSPGYFFLFFIQIIIILFLLAILIRIISNLTRRIINIGLPGYYVLFLLIINTIGLLSPPEKILLATQHLEISYLLLDYPLIQIIAGPFTLASLIIQILLYIYPGKDEQATT